MIQDLLKSCPRWLESKKAVFLCVFLVALGFAAYTDHVWEDYYITYRASKNLATGKGLVYTEGQRVHSFTSPLGVLVPSACSLTVWNSSDQAALWLFRLISIGLLGWSALWLLDLARSQKLSRGGMLLLFLLFAFDPKIVDFSINGMETAFVMFFLTYTLKVLMEEGERSYLKLGMGWAGLMWSRPDSCIYIALMGLAFLLFNPPGFVSRTRKEWVLMMFKAAGVTTCLYLPWFLWAWSYYGSPVPHTVTAKGLSEQPLFWGDYPFHFLFFPLKAVSQDVTFQLTFWPSYAALGGWNGVILEPFRILAGFCALYWLFPLGRPFARALSFIFCGGHFYLSYFSPFCFAWYLPTLVVLGFLILIQGLEQLMSLSRIFGGAGKPEGGEELLLRFAGWLSVGVVVIQLGSFVGTAIQMRAQQRIVEDGNRRRVGEYLRAESPAGATVFLEPVGYIGYFSGLKMYHFPGLTSPEMIEARKQVFLDDWGAIIRKMEPTWVVLRPNQAEWIKGWHSGLLEGPYQLDREFDVSGEIEQQEFLPGRNYLLFDQKYLVFRRNPKMEL